ncbi:MAG: HlyU family transcriptional regulator, partial [Pseudomonadota bacterium]
MAGFFSRLFGGGDKAESAIPETPDETYKEVEIRAVPQSDGGQWRVGGQLTKIVDGKSVTRTFMRADVMNSKEEAAVVS